MTSTSTALRPRGTTRLRTGLPQQPTGTGHLPDTIGPRTALLRCPTRAAAPTIGHPLTSPLCTMTGPTITGLTTTSPTITGRAPAMTGPVPAISLLPLMTVPAPLTTGQALHTIALAYPTTSPVPPMTARALLTVRPTAAGPHIPPALPLPIALTVMTIGIAFHTGMTTGETGKSKTKFLAADLHLR